MKYTDAGPKSLCEGVLDDRESASRNSKVIGNPAPSVENGLLDSETGNVHGCFPS